MDFMLEYVGPPGDISAELTCGGKLVAEEGGFADAKAVEKWAAKTARDHKVANTPEATRRHIVRGGATFSL